MQLRCPECLSEVAPPDRGDLRCGNCGETFEREAAMVSVADAEEQARDFAGCTCDSVRGCPRCFQRADELVGAQVRDSQEREWRVTDVDEKNGYPILCGETCWSYLDDVAVLSQARGPEDPAGA